MSKMQRSKGANGERELFRLLSDHLGTIIKRNLSQTRNGGADSLDLPGYAIEVKRQEAIRLDAWWQQCVEQAIAQERVPMLAYRQSRKPWRIILPLWHVATDLPPATGYRVEMGIEEFCFLARERFGDA